MILVCYIYIHKRIEGYNVKEWIGSFFNEIFFNYIKFILGLNNLAKNKTKKLEKTLEIIKIVIAV